MQAPVPWTTCPGCASPQSVRLVAGGGKSLCLKCGRPVRSVLFPALVPKPPPPPPLPGDLPGEGEAVCFYNPQRRATTSCAQCGVFISDAWSAKWGTRTLCLRCLEKLQASQRGTEFESQRWLWDNIVLLLALAPLCLIIWWVGFLSAPAAIILGIWAWKKPSSLVPRPKFRLIAGIALAAIEVVAAIAIIYKIAEAIGSS